MKILFFFWFVFMVNASNNVELQKSYRAKDYQTVVGMAEKYPSLFSANAENLSVLALAQYHLNNWHLAVKTCALVQNIEPMRTCSNLVQKVKKDKKELFDLGGCCITRF